MDKALELGLGLLAFVAVGDVGIGGQQGRIGFHRGKLLAHEAEGFGFVALQAQRRKMPACNRSTGQVIPGHRRLAVDLIHRRTIALAAIVIFFVRLHTARHEIYGFCRSRYDVLAGQLAVFDRYRYIGDRQLISVYGAGGNSEFRVLGERGGCLVVCNGHRFARHGLCRGKLEVLGLQQASREQEKKGRDPSKVLHGNGF